MSPRAPSGCSALPPSATTIVRSSRGRASAGGIIGGALWAGKQPRSWGIGSAAALEEHTQLAPGRTETCKIAGAQALVCLAHQVERTQPPCIVRGGLRRGGGIARDTWRRHELSAERSDGSA